MTELEFGELEVGDIPAVAELEQQLFSCPWSEQAFLETFHQDTLFVTARTGHEIAGYCGMYCYAGGEGEITNVAPLPESGNRPQNADLSVGAGPQPGNGSDYFRGARF